MDIDTINIDVDLSTPSDSVGVTPTPAGPQGLSAYEVAVKNGFIGTETQWLDSLVGETGEPGPQGLPGIPGSDGQPGRDGAIQYTAGDNITIENNVISATIPNTIATKQYVDDAIANAITNAIGGSY